MGWWRGLPDGTCEVSGVASTLKMVKVGASMAGGSFCSVISLASPSRMLGRKTAWLTFVDGCACLALQRHVGEIRLYTVNSRAVFSIPVMLGLMMQGSSELADKPGRSLLDAPVSPGPDEYRGTRASYRSLLATHR